MNVPALVILISLSVLSRSEVREVETCSIDVCKIDDNCRCSFAKNPVTDLENPSPQLVAITFNDEITQLNYETYWKPLFFDRKNPDNSSLGLTFYVSHEYTDYALVHDLYSRGYEIGDYSVTKTSNFTFWKTASQKDLEDEFGGQKTIISTFAKIPESDIKGVRTPYFNLNGDVSINAYESSGLTYDSSWLLRGELSFPYTLDYRSSQFCSSIIDCPEESHPGFWITPIINMDNMNSGSCDYFSSCDMQGSPTQIANWLYGQIRVINRAPIILLLDLNWFRTVENSYEGFELFLEGLKTVDDVFLVTVQDILEWMKKPVPARDYMVPNHNDRTSNCLDLICPLQDEHGQMQYMKSCVSCPEVYPWKGNPLGRKK